MRGLAAIAVAIATALAPAAASAASCPPPPALTGWDRPFPLVAATGAAQPPLARIAIGRAAVVTLAATEQVVAPVATLHAGGPVRYAGFLVLEVRVPGTYRVALGGPAWIDVVAAGRPVDSIAHAPGPDCSSVRKTVDFALAPGRYALQLSDARAPTLTAMVVRLPG